MGNGEYRLVVRDDPKSPAAESIRTLRTNLQYLSLDKPLKSIMVTSALPGEGKTSIAGNLALALADAGLETILAGVDLRKPTLHKMFDLSNAIGITSILTGRVTLGEALQDSGHPGLRILPAGPVPPSPAELLGSRAMRSLIAELERTADMVIFDAPPVISVTDAALLAPAIGGTLLVVSLNQTPRDFARQAKAQLEKVKARVLGVVVNRIEIKRSESYYYYYDSSRQEAAANGKPRLERAFGRLIGGR